MEDLILVVLAGTAVFFTVQILIELYTLIDHAIVSRKSDRNPDELGSSRRTGG